MVPDTFLQGIAILGSPAVSANRGVKILAGGIMLWGTQQQIRSKLKMFENVQNPAAQTASNK